MSDLRISAFQSSTGSRSVGSSAHLLCSREAYTIITQEVYDQFPNGIPHEQFQNFDGFVQFNPAAPSFPGPPTPPNSIPAAHAPSGVQSGPGPVNVNGNGGGGPQPHSVADIIPLTNKSIDLDEQTRRQASNSEDDDLTPAQSRRKAQNRAAYVLPCILSTTSHHTKPI